MMYVKGIDYHELSVDSDKVMLGDNNRSWIHRFDPTEPVPQAYFHDYVAGTLSVEVDLSNVECSCATGI